MPRTTRAQRFFERCCLDAIVWPDGLRDVAAIGTGMHAPFGQMIAGIFIRPLAPAFRGRITVDQQASSAVPYDGATMRRSFSYRL